MTPSGTVLLFGFLICASQGEVEKTEAEIPLRRSTCGLDTVKPVNSEHRGAGIVCL